MTQILVITHRVRNGPKVRFIGTLVATIEQKSSYDEWQLRVAIAGTRFASAVVHSHARSEQARVFLMVTRHGA
jgi:hypothetical protein